MDMGLTEERSGRTIEREHTRSPNQDAQTRLCRLPFSRGPLQGLLRHDETVPIHQHKGGTSPITIRCWRDRQSITLGRVEVPLGSHHPVSSPHSIRSSPCSLLFGLLGYTVYMLQVYKICLLASYIDVRSYVWPQAAVTRVLGLTVSDPVLGVTVAVAAAS